jgi:hypothetical protein
MFHLNNHSEISQKDYIIKYMFNGISPKCKCGCGGEVEILINGNNCDLKKCNPPVFFIDIQLYVKI